MDNLDTEVTQSFELTITSRFHYHPSGIKVVVGPSILDASLLAHNSSFPINDPDHSFGKMSRRTSVSVKLMEQAQFAVNEEKFDRAKSYAENLFAYSNKYGVLLIAKGNKLIASSISEFEKDFQGGDEQEIDASMVISTKTFQSSVKFVTLATASDYVAVYSDGKVHLYHMSLFLDKVGCPHLVFVFESVHSTQNFFDLCRPSSLARPCNP